MCPNSLFSTPSGSVSRSMAYPTHRDSKSRTCHAPVRARRCTFLNGLEFLDDMSWPGQIRGTFAGPTIRAYRSHSSDTVKAECAGKLKDIVAHDQDAGFWGSLSHYSC